ncbi:unnamed protein product [Staurois parvus]|uniref:Transposase Tc1-like domain-containing protein n=1 Tax=Staurois parvus TaxID=386267 RepID=A0ABN9AZZ4_9NEOB|nr:unnamed protein product [Staurois parvus]
MTEWGQRMLKRTVRRSCQLSAEPIAKDLQTSCGLQISTATVHRELHEMGFLLAEQLHQSHTSPSVIQSIRCSGAKYAATGLYSSADVFSGVTNHASLSSNPIGLVVSRKTLPA